ncbi:uncharacterized protein [Miscanthus floridulus]|uniref:uncharacterized protein n=1 Tax=Miscanthus floridulus TaxID=154761 RepID=UPI003458EE31
MVDGKHPTGGILEEDLHPCQRLRILGHFRKEPLTFKVVNFLGVYHALLGQPCFAKFMAIPNYTYHKLKMPSPKGVITIEGSFELAYHYEQDYVAQAAALVAPYAPDGPGHDKGRVPMEEAAKAMAMLNQPSIGKAVKTSGSRNGSTSPSIRALGPLEGVDPIQVSFNLSP